MNKSATKTIPEQTMAAAMNPVSEPVGAAWACATLLARIRRRVVVVGGVRGRLDGIVCVMR